MRAIGYGDKACRYGRRRCARGAGVKPGALGSDGTALKAAYDTLDPAGGKAWQMLRAAGANLDFSPADWPMWDIWARYADGAQILAQWDGLRRDPVMLARSAPPSARPSPPFGAPKDARGPINQPDCPTSSAESLAVPEGAARLLDPFQPRLDPLQAPSRPLPDPRQKACFT